MGLPLTKRINLNKTDTKKMTSKTRTSFQFIWCCVLQIHLLSEKKGARLFFRKDFGGKKKIYIYEDYFGS